MAATRDAAAAQPAGRLRWIPRHHGAWAMLAIPFLLGIAASRGSWWHFVLAIAAVTGYLASAAGLDWLRARRRTYGVPALTFGLACGTACAALLVAHPGLLVIGGWIATATVIAGATALAGRPRSLVASLAQVGQALALVPAAALVSGEYDPDAVNRATLLAGLYLVGSVLLVRSMIRERGNRVIFAASVAFHGAAVVVAAVVLGPAFAMLALALLARALALPPLQERLAAGPRRLRPIHIGIVEIVASVALVVVALVAGF